MALLPTLFANAELSAKFRSGAVSKRANVGENALLKPVAFAFDDVMPVVTVDEPFSFELCSIHAMKSEKLLGTVLHLH